MTEHTPTPWGVWTEAQIDLVAIIRADGEIIADMHKTGDDGTEIANKIVRCVNSHDALVKALEDMVDNFNEEKLEWMVSAEKYAVANARAALAAAKEEKP